MSNGENENFKPQIEDTFKAGGCSLLNIGLFKGLPQFTILCRLDPAANRDLFEQTRSAMEEDSQPGCQLRRRRCFANSSQALNLDFGYNVNESCSSQGTPSPSYIKLTPSTVPSTAKILQDFKNRQQSFDIQVEDCEEIEILIESDDEGDGEGEENASVIVPNRPVTPTPVQDFGTSVVYTEGPQASDFLKVKVIEQDCCTDVSDAGSDDDEEE